MNPLNSPDYQDIAKLASSPAGKRLMEYLNNRSGAELESAMEQMKQGDLQGAKEIIQRIMADPGAAELLREMRGTP